MYSNLFSAQSVQDLMTVLPSLPYAIWETFYMTVLSTALSLVIGLPLGVLLVAGDKDGILPLPGWLMHLINIVINILRSVPFLILIYTMLPVTRFVVGTAIGTKGVLLPLFVSAFPFVARLVESSAREVDRGVIEASRSMGASVWQVVVKVLVPEAMPSILSGATIAATTILGYSAMAGVAGGGGLGAIAINYGYSRYNYAVMLTMCAVIVIVVQLIETLGKTSVRLKDRRLR